VGYINTIKDVTEIGNWHLSDEIMTLHTTHYGWCQLHQSQGFKKKKLYHVYTCYQSMQRW
jgi:hypothetical protein